tara:strand:+ start:696 stop:1007 length:312 start_codon:yes stop_codon:yes gene_type:complete
MSKVSDNYHKNFPARMSDGRFITDYSPNCQMNGVIQQNMTSWQYKTYLSRYSDKLMSETNQINDKLYGCKNCNNVSLPIYSQQLCKPSGCQINVVNENGLGME